MCQTAGDNGVGMNEVLRAAAFVTDFADQAVILPLAAVIAVALYAGGWRRGALAWTVAIIATLGLMLVLKIGFGACGRYIAGGQIESPSGHTAAAGVLYGSIFAFLAERMFGRTPLTLAVILAIVVVVGVSRVLLGAHTILEVCIGAAVGGIAAWLMVRGAGKPAQTSPSALLLLPVCAVLFLFHGLHLPAEAAIRGYATSWSVWACR